jgi:hypothetical protein
VAIGARQTRRDLETLLRQAPAGARDLKCFVERKATSVKRARFGGIWPDVSITMIAGNFLSRLVLALPATGRERMPFAFTTQCAYGLRISPSSRKLRLGRTPSTSKSLRYRGQYNHRMADRIACSCVTCPKCGTWVVVRQPSEAGLGNEKHRASCPAPECGKEFEFEAGETRVFEVPLPLFERRHFYGSELR